MYNIDYQIQYSSEILEEYHIIMVGNGAIAIRVLH